MKWMLVEFISSALMTYYRSFGIFYNIARQGLICIQRDAACGHPFGQPGLFSFRTFDGLTHAVMWVRYTVENWRVGIGKILVLGEIQLAALGV